MITVYGNGIYWKVDESRINYFYINASNDVIIQKDNSETAVIRHSNYREMDVTIAKLSTALRKQLATFGVLTTVMFVCVNKVSSYTETSTLNIVFQNSEIINLSFHSAHETRNNFNYLEKLYLSCNLADYIADKTKHYVNPNYVENLTQRKYNSWSRALEYASSGDVVIMEKAMYKDIFVFLKDGVDTVMQDCVFEYRQRKRTRASIMDSIPLNTNPVTCNIFGNGVFKFHDGATENSNWQLIDTHSESYLYFEFDEAFANDNGGTSFLHQWRGTIWAKGNLFYSESSRTYDSEAIEEPIIIDLDVAYNITEGGSVMYVPYVGVYAEYYFRNCYFENNQPGDVDYNGEGMLDIQTPIMFNMNMIHSKYNVRNTPSEVGAAYLLYTGAYYDFETTNENAYMRLWECRMYNITPEEHSLIMFEYTIDRPIITISKTYANCETYYTTFENSEDYVIEEDMVIERDNFTDIVFENSYFIRLTTDNVLTNYNKGMAKKTYMLQRTGSDGLLTILNNMYPNQSTILTDKYSVKYLINIEKVISLHKDTIQNRIVIVFETYEIWYDTTSQALDATYTSLLDLKTSWETFKQNIYDL